MPTAHEIKLELEKSGFFVTEKAIIEFVEEFGPKVDSITNNILDTDFKDIGDKILPKDITKVKESQSVKLPLVLQIVSVRNISQPESKQWSSTHIDDQSSRRTLLLHLTDGHTVCRALEVSQLSQISVKGTQPGSKIRISGDLLKTHQGFLIFDTEVKVEVLGGTVPALIQTWKAKHLAATRKLLGTKSHADGEAPPEFKPIQITQPTLPAKEKMSHKPVQTKPEASAADNSQKNAQEAISNINNNNNTTNTQHKPYEKKQPQQKRQQPRQNEKNQTQTSNANTQSQTSNANTQSQNREAKQKEPKYREVNKPVQVESVKEPSIPKEAPQQNVTTKPPAQQHYVPKQRAEYQNSNDRKKTENQNTYNRKKTSESKFVPKQQQAQAYKQKPTQQVALSYLPQITQFPVTFSATCRVLQIFLANSGERFFLQFSLQDASNQVFPAIVDNPELLEHIVSLSIADLQKNCATPEGQAFVQKRTEQAFQSFLNQVATFTFAVIYPGIPFTILSLQ